MADQDQVPGPLPVIIIGAGVSGLLLAQYLRKTTVPFRIYERDADLTTRGVGWGLTLHWSLPALRSLLPEDLVARLPEAYVDRAAVTRGEASAFPFFDLSTGELKGASPRAPESLRIRVTRERLRRLIATDVDIQWEKSLARYEEKQDSVDVFFEDGSSVTGRILVACDGGPSRVRRQLFPDQHARYQIPVRVLGLKVFLSPDQMAPMRELDPFFLQGTSSRNDTFLYFSMLGAPGNNDESTGQYSCQMCISWPNRPGFLGKQEPTDYPQTNAGKIELIKSFAEGWSEPFRGIALGIPHDTDVKQLDLYDYPPPKGLRSKGRVVLMGDAFHAMAMYRGEGANHAILDVLDFAENVTPKLDAGFTDVRTAIDAYEDEVVARARPGVLASRRACMDAHDWPKISPTSPLLSKREMKLHFDEE
ncbi:FAD binding domain-containing protein [Colletotrichum graminicola]|uniref:FAD binding domain-containing protein n=1 Tax=Colletotrichum graminicola (strain M1.001 / M2 / FGSC 10212) TaxID=645133 RepID=E3Q5K7_COLGM|nr:FAD binding domain-containing protein [Colletotrichum graminicola M1.001]EFQ25974.1 FAD binding domain-containing protein [Colletotrichum graminicola M1.001]WDK23096.1 FAD binding domain-containing protein [Colletotrichum graminicola]